MPSKVFLNVEVFYNHKTPTLRPLGYDSPTAYEVAIAGGFFPSADPMAEEMIKQYLGHHFESNPNDDFNMLSNLTLPIL